MDWHPFIQQALKLLGSKKLAAIICVTWVLLHIATACPSQFVQLTAFCQKNMYMLDLIALFSTACLIVSSFTMGCRYLNPHLSKFYLKRTAVKKIKRILKAPESDDYKLLMALHKTPNTHLNVYDPLVKNLRSYCVICRTGDALLSDDLVTYRGPFDLTHFTTQYMNTQCRH